MPRWCDTMYRLMQAFSVFKCCDWKALIYYYVSSNGVENYDAIYDDFRTMTKEDFCSKWQGNADSPIEYWYNRCRESYDDWHKAENFLDATNKLLEDITC